MLASPLSADDRSARSVWFAYDDQASSLLTARRVDSGRTAWSASQQILLAVCNGVVQTVSQVSSDDPNATTTAWFRDAATGEVLYKVSPVETAPGIWCDGRRFVSNQAGRLVATDARTGKVTWSMTTPGALLPGEGSGSPLLYAASVTGRAQLGLVALSVRS